MSEQMIMAVAIGLAFGWSLERAGLGDANKLAGQFYLRDFTVVKVMFSAILTAMLGLFWLGRLGLIDLAAIYVPETWLWPQIVGGLIFGAGFVLSGLCPGTACVATASGRGDGLATVFGLFAGVLLTGLAWPGIADFADSTARGAFTLPQLTGLPYGVVVMAITGLGLVTFIGIEHAEAALGGASMTITRRFGFTALGLGGLGLGLGAAFAGSPYRHKAGQIDVGRAVQAIDDGTDHVTALELATWIRDRKPGLRVVDVRPPAEFAAYAIPTAENLPLAALMRTAFQPHEIVVLYSEGGAHAGQAWVLLRALGVFNAYFIAGGLADWRDEVMAPVLSPDATPQQKQAFEQTADLSRYFGGQPAVGESACPAPTVAATGARRRGC